MFVPCYLRANSSFRPDDVRFPRAPRGAQEATTGETTKRNPFIGYKQGDKFSMVGADGGLDTLIAHGTVVLACNNAFTGIVSMLANKEKISRDDARKAALAALVPGVTLMPNGVFAVGAAQNGGCGVLTVR